MAQKVKTILSLRTIQGIRTRGRIEARREDETRIIDREMERRKLLTTQETTKIPNNNKTTLIKTLFLYCLTLIFYCKT